MAAQTYKILTTTWDTLKTACRTAIGAAYTKAASKGATLPQNQTLANLEGCIDSITIPTILPKIGTVLPGIDNIDVYPDPDADGMSVVEVAGDSDLIAENIRDGVDIFNVMGSFSGFNHYATGILTDADVTFKGYTFNCGFRPKLFYVINRSSAIDDIPSTSRPWPVTYGILTENMPTNDSNNTLLSYSKVQYCRTYNGAASIRATSSAVSLNPSGTGVSCTYTGSITYISFRGDYEWYAFG